MKSLLTILLSFFTLTIYSQDFVEKDAFLYKGSKVKPIVVTHEGLQQYMYKNFYLYFDTVTKVLTTDFVGKKKTPFKPFQKGDLSYNCTSEYSKLVEYEFTVLNVHSLAPKYDYEEKDRFFILTLNNPTLGNIYYKYDARYKHDLEFTVIGGLTYPDGYFCSKFSRQHSKIEKKTRFYSPSIGGVGNFTISKTIESDTSEIFYLSIKTYGTTLNVGKRGVSILFEDGTLFSRDEKIDVDVDGKYYEYSAFIQLSMSDLELFKNKTVTDYQLYVYESQVQPHDGRVLKELFNCVENLK